VEERKKTIPNWEREEKKKKKKRGLNMRLSQTRVRGWDPTPFFLRNLSPCWNMKIKATFLNTHISYKINVCRNITTQDAESNTQTNYNATVSSTVHEIQEEEIGE